MNTQKNHLYIIVYFLIMVIVLYVQFLCADYGDKNVLLHCARQFAHGGRLYKDTVDLATPLILLIYAIPELLADHTGMRDSICLLVLGLPVIALSLYVSLELMRHTPQLQENASKQVHFMMLLGFVFITAQTACYFLDREHLFLVLCLPYILRFAPSLAPVAFSLRLRLLIGIMAGIGFCLKLHLILFFLLLQGVLFAWKRSPAFFFMAETLIIYVLIASYLLLMWCFTSDYILVYIPMAWATYSAFNLRITWSLYLPAVFINLGMILADFRLRHASPYRRDIVYFLSLFPLFLLYVLMNNGWSYTLNLLFGYIIILNGFVLEEFYWLRDSHARQGQSVKPFVFGIRANWLSLLLHSLVIMVLLTGEIINRPPGYLLKRQATDALIESVKQLNNGSEFKNFGAISLENDVWARIGRYTALPMETRFSHLWMIPKFVINDDAFFMRHEKIVRYVSLAFAEDMRVKKPEIMFVDSHISYGIILNQSIDFLRYLKITKEFNQEWNHYRYLGEVDALPDIVDRLAAIIILVRKGCIPTPYLKE